jgi:hypothetical protein
MFNGFSWVSLRRFLLSAVTYTDLGPVVHRLPLGLTSSSRRAFVWSEACSVMLLDLSGYESTVVAHKIDILFYFSCGDPL